MHTSTDVGKGNMLPPCGCLLLR